MNPAARSARPLASARFTRRQFTASLLAVAAGTVAAPAIVRGRNLNSKLNIAVIGAGGRGAGNADGVSSENIVALVRREREEPGTDGAAISRRRARRWTSASSSTDRRISMRSR